MSSLTSNVNNFVPSVFEPNEQGKLQTIFNDLNNSACRKRSRSKRRHRKSRSKRRHRKRSRSRKRRRRMRSRSRKRARRRSRSRKRARRSSSRKRSCRKRSGSKKRITRHKRSAGKCGRRGGCVWRESHYPKFKQPACCKQRLKYKISPFSLWVQKNMKGLKGKGDASQIMRALAKSWKCLSPMDKAKFYQKAAGSKNQKCS